MKLQSEDSSQLERLETETESTHMAADELRPAAPYWTFQEHQQEI